MEVGLKTYMNKLFWRVVCYTGISLALVWYALGPTASLPVLAQVEQARLPPGALAQTPPITLDVPILLYHEIGGSGTRYNLPVKDFAAQMEYLSKHGYTSVSIDQIAAALRGQGDLPPCPIAITLDDAYRGAYTNAVPILQQYGFRATYYLPTDHLGRSARYMTWDQARDLVSKGMWIGSHSLSHPLLARLSRLSAQYQITESKSILEAQLGISITTFAYPFGSLGASVERATVAAGYTAALWTGYSWQHTTDRIYRLKRVGVYSPIRLTTFSTRLPKHGPTGTGTCPLIP